MENKVDQEKLNEITLVQAPIIRHTLEKIGDEVTDRLEKLNLNNQIATEDSIQALKTLRADLNKELASYEEQRKAIRTKISEPYDKFNVEYKLNISDKYEGAIGTLKTTIGTFEDKVKTDKKASVVSYFSELCLSEKIDFLKFEDLNLEINLTTTEKAYKTKCNEFATKVNDDLALAKTITIKDGNDIVSLEAEIVAEYKRSLNISKAIKDVQDRKERERQEKERMKLVEKNRRIGILNLLPLSLNAIIKTYEYEEDPTIYITMADIENLGKEEFANKVVEIEEAILLKKQANEQPMTAPGTLPFDEVKPEAEQGTAPIIKKPVAPVSAPVEKPKVQVFKATFEVSGTRDQLKALGEYMKQNKLTYINL